VSTIIGGEEVFLAGHMVPAGVYRQVDSHREVKVKLGESLPASYDGHVAEYIRCPELWGDRPSVQVCVVSPDVG
jgi:hypothetical protein